jgi:hypothetical protein
LRKVVNCCYGESLTPTSGNPIAALPIIVPIAFTLAGPKLWRLFHPGAVDPYVLTPEAWDKILSASADVRLPKQSSSGGKL